MIISDLNHLESVANAAVYGSTGRSRGFSERDYVSTTFETTNKFKTIIEAPKDVYNFSASAGAKGVTDVGKYSAYGAYTKADTLAVVDIYGNSFSSSASAALITP